MDRGVSDVLGFILVFSLILGGVAMVYAGGYGALAHVRDVERVNNAERAFDVFDSNMDDLVTGGAPSRATELKLADSTVRTGQPVVVNVSFATAPSYETTIDPIVFDSRDGDRLTYTDGAVIRGTGAESVMIDDPTFLLGSRTVIPIVKTRARGTGVGGSGRVLVRSVVAQRTVENYTAPGNYSMTINVTTSNTAAWQEYLEPRTSGTCTVSGSTVSCTHEADAVFLQVTTVDVFIQ